MAMQCIQTVVLALIVDLMEQAPKNWTCTSCMLSEVSNGSDNVNCHVDFLI